MKKLDILKIYDLFTKAVDARIRAHAADTAARGIADPEAAFDAEEVADAAWDVACSDASEARTPAGAAEQLLRECTETLCGEHLAEFTSMPEELRLKAEIRRLRRAILENTDEDRYATVVAYILRNFVEGTDIIIFGENEAAEEWTVPIVSWRGSTPRIVTDPFDYLYN